MAITSIDNLVSAMAAGQYQRADWAKVTAATVAYTAGNYYDLSQVPGSPVANTYPGAALVAQTPTDLNPGFGMWLGGDVSPSVKNLVNLGAYSSVATSVPGKIDLFDIVMYYPGINNLITTAQTLINSNTFTASSSSGLLLTYTNDFGTATVYTTVQFSNSGGALPTGLVAATTYWLVRQSATTAKVSTSYANAVAGTFIAFTDAGSGTNTLTVTPNRYADGAGLRMLVVQTVTTGTPAATPVVSAAGFQYTNQSGTTGKVLGAVVNYTAGAANVPTPGKVVHSGVAANNFLPFLPLAAGDRGVQRVTQYQISTAYTTATVMTSALLLVKPLASVPIVTASAAGERNLIMQVPSMPVVKDGACVVPFFFAGAALAANSPIMGYADAAWG
jgi:hypothetical protein